MVIEGLLGAGALGFLIVATGKRKAQKQAAAAAQPVFESATLKLWITDEGLHGEVKQARAQLTRKDWGGRSSKYTLLNDGTGSFQMPALMAPFWVRFHLNTTSKEVYVAGTPDRTIGHVNSDGFFQATTHRGTEGRFVTETAEVGTVNIEFHKALECKLDYGADYCLTLPKREAAALLRWVKHRPTQLVPWGDNHESSLVNA